MNFAGSTNAGPGRLGGIESGAGIKTGERRVIEFLLSPIVRTASESLRER